jgi:Flp pilus assembly pilin Flp
VTRLLLAARARCRGRCRWFGRSRCRWLVGDDCGQGTLEYVGMIVAVAVVVVAVIAVLRGVDLGDKIHDAFTNVFG